MEIYVKQIVKQFIPETILELENFSTGGMNVEHAYKIKTSKDQYILKSLRDDHIEEVQRASNVTAYLMEKGFDKVTQNISTTESSYIYSDKQGSSWELQKFITGEQLRGYQLKKTHIINLATTLTDLHKTSLDVKPEIEGLADEITYTKMFDSEQHKKSIEYINNLNQLNIPHEDEQLLNKYWKTYCLVREEIISKLDNQEISLQKSLIHRDLNKGNILFKPDSFEIAAFVDWDTVTWGNILQDVCYICSHYILVKNIGEIEHNVSVKNIQTFIDTYQKYLPLNKSEKVMFIPLVDILITRATRWWIKRYVELINQSIEGEEALKKFSNFQGGFRNTIENWLNNRNKVLELFSNIKIN